MLFQKKGFKGSRILSTITSYAGGGGGGYKKKKSSDQSDSLQVFKQGGILRVTAQLNSGPSSTTADTKNDTIKKPQISALTAAKMACNEWNMPKISSPRVSKSAVSSSPGACRPRLPQKKATSPMPSKGFNSSWDHPAFRSSLYNGPNYLNKFQKPRRFEATNIHGRIFRNLGYPLQSIQESEDENLH